jgi:hypothetical protein
MKRQNLLLMINAIILTVITIGFVVTYAIFVPKTSYDKLFGETVQLGEITQLNQVPVNPTQAGQDYPEYDLILTFQEAFNRQGEKIGYVYRVRSQYNYFTKQDIGVMQLLVGIRLDNTVTVQIEDLKQTSIYSPGIQAYINEKFQGFKTNQLGSIPSRELNNYYDLDASGTASASTSKVKELVKLAIDFYVAGNQELETDPLILWFGEGYILEDDNTFVPTALVIAKHIVKNSNQTVIGSYYQLRGTGVYYDTNEGTINVYVALDVDGVILGISIPKEEYGHTKSDTFHGKSVVIANGLIGTNITSFVADNDLQTGATNSTNLFQTLIEALGGVWS